MCGKINNKVLVENIVYLSILQGVNYILPLVTFPYLVRTLGLEKFGLLAFGMSFAQYFVLITDYGFNLTATQEISRCREEIKEVSRIFCSVMIFKVLLMVFSGVVYILIVLLFTKFRIDIKLFLIMFLAVPGSVLYPVWLFQGLEKMKLLSLISGSVKVAITLMIFLFVRKPTDYLIAALIQVSGVLLSGLVALIIIVCLFRLLFVLPSKNMIIDTARKGWYVFISQVSVTMFTNSNIFILGLFASNTVVGYFSIADKIIKAVVGITVPITTAVYPHISELFLRSRESALVFVKKLMIYGSMFFFLISVTLFLFSDIIVVLISGKINTDISVIVKIMSILPLSVFWDNIWGTQVMLNNGMSRQFMYTMLGAGVFSVFSSLVFVPIYEAFATSVIFVVTELLILSAMVYFVRMKRIYIVKDRAF